MHRWVRNFEVLCLAFWLGASIWFVFIQSPLLFRAVPGIAPVLQELLFPRYWNLGYGCLGLGTLFLLVRAFLYVDKSLFLKAIVLSVMIGLLAIIQFKITPEVRSLGSQLIEAGAHPDPEVKKAFGKWHGIAMGLNLVVFLVVLLVTWLEICPKQKFSND
ncbi:MAG: DUF4149 domain-containing protein [Verrucomicrobiae bacterium]|nr:DUF4149 domain-containing protein [Verrucomicrobiae bacterium]